MKDTTKWMRYHLQYFAQEGDGGEKTEPATTKKLKDARDKGQVAKSKEISSAFLLLALFLCLKYLTGRIGISFIESFTDVYHKIPEIIDGPDTSVSVYTVTILFRNILFQTFIAVLPVFSVGFLVALLSDLLQVKWNPTLKPLQPRLDKLNPINGYKRIVSTRSIFELVKSITKIAIILYVAYSALKNSKYIIYSLYGIPLKAAIYHMGKISIDLGIKMSIAYMLIGVSDLIFEKYKFGKDMRMSKQEIKEEWKNAEGNPEIKRKIRSKMQESSRRRMMKDVTTADVVITNPTHFAAALKYDSNVSKAPILVAKGEDFLAKKIKEVAKEGHIEIVENKPLARMLYYNVDLGAEVPPELYQAVAEVLAYVYSLKKN